MFSNLSLVHHSHGPHLPRHELRHQHPGHLEQNHVGGKVHPFTLSWTGNLLMKKLNFITETGHFVRALSLYQGWNCRSPFHYDLPRCISPGQKKQCVVHRQNIH